MTFDAQRILDGLTPFQRRTVEHVTDRFYGNSPTRRYLVADETGLGKSMVARGVIARAIEHLIDEPSIDRIDIVYICSNQAIAQQNLKRLDILGLGAHQASRLSRLAVETNNLRGPAQPDVGKRVNLISFTPGTSLDLRSSYGQASERALLYCILRDELNLDESGTAGLRLMLRGYSSAAGFEYPIWSIENRCREATEAGVVLPDPAIVEPFLAQVANDGLLDEVYDVVRSLAGRTELDDAEFYRCRNLVGGLRHRLARAGIDALEPDLVILDEFQRFRHLLDRHSTDHGAAAELAHDMFDHPDAQVLLLSATPYKAFTFADEASAGDDHDADLRLVLEFLSNGSGVAERIVDNLRRFRDAMVAARPVEEVRAELERDLLALMCRTERPRLGDDEMLAEVVTEVDDVTSDDLVSHALIERLADALDAQFNIDYWKSTPYFLNFGDGYQVVDRYRRALDDPEIRHLADGAIDRIQTLDAAGVEGLEPIDPSNARMRRFVDDALDDDVWQLLWVPPSLPYEPHGGPFATVPSGLMPKRLVFSSWTAVPTAIAALVSHEATRQVVAGDPAALRVEPRFQWHRELYGDEYRPAAMTTLALFWPSPAHSRSIDPLVDREPPEELPGRGPGGAEGWYWSELFTSSGAIPDGLNVTGAVERFEPGQRDGVGLRSHIELAIRLQTGSDNGSAARRVGQPHDLDAVVGHLARYGPGNIALRCVGRLVASSFDAGAEVSHGGRWAAAATISGAVRSLFNRPEVIALIDQLIPDAVMWRAVLRYCRWGNLEAVLDEFLHHVSAADRQAGLTDDSLLAIAEQARDAITPRPSTFRVFDPHRPNERISMTARYGLRYGSGHGSSADEQQHRMEDVRGAFNSPFWPFVLATTSIGQEGIDFHWWCSTAVHWNTPASPVDFEQREGRVHRYGGLAIRRNLAYAHGAEIIGAAAAGEHPWDAAYRLGSEAANDPDGLKPHWVTPGPASITRQLYPYPLSRDVARYRRLKDDLALYRLTFGQPRQEDLLDLLRERGTHAEEETAARYQLSLRPPGD